ncbi:MAG: acyltransferase family protein [Planctomycetota bacterium]|nr:acyltransferase family protein [Planctomycetota bacterium]
MSENAQPHPARGAEPAYSPETGNFRRSAAVVVAERPKAPYVPYLEGLRGLAALSVTIYHIWGHTLNAIPLTGFRAVARDWIGAVLFGRVAVDIFIVLSGYLLMRPAARSADGKLPGGIWHYLQRRAWRILPPYYAALFLTLGLEIAIPALRTPLSMEWRDSLPPFGTRNIVAHLLLVHNLSFHWASKIDAPMWTVATEWQIYFIFPLLLLPVWRRFGSWAAMATGLILGLGCYYLVGGQSAAPWYLGLFAFGMASAARGHPEKARQTDRAVFGWLAIILFALYGVSVASIQLGAFGRFGVHGMEETWRCYWPTDILVGAATACFTTFAAVAVQGRTSRVVAALSTRWLAGVGVVSYSLYLIHDPLFAVMKVPLNHLNVGPFGQMFAMLFVGLPIVMAITYGFHLIFEKPFMSTRRVRATETKAADEPGTVSIAPIAPYSLPIQPQLRILMLPDLHIKDDSPQQKMLVGARDFLDDHDWVVLMGDMTACYGTPGEYGAVDRFVRAMGRPYSVVNGNHEICFQQFPEGSSGYGHTWVRAGPDAQQQQLRRFADFYGIESSFQATSHPLAAVCLLGLDGIEEDSRAVLTSDHEAWFECRLAEFFDRPLLVFSHVPIEDARLDEIRYYTPGNRPYYVPSPQIARALNGRLHPTFWFSGHLHLGCAHPLFKPYQTPGGTWQIHCPDGAGVGRPNNKNWNSQRYRGLFVRSVALDAHGLRVITTDLQTGLVIDTEHFDLRRKLPARPELRRIPVHV